MSSGEVSDADQEELKAKANRLIQEMKQTKGARFNASARLESRDRSRTRVIAYASTAVVVVTILPRFFPVPTLVDGLIGLSTVAFSLAILAASLLQSSNGDPVRAVKLHSCALEVNSLLRELRANNVYDHEKLRSYSARYDSILMRHAVNHDQIDYERYKFEHPDEFPAMEPAFQRSTLKLVTDSTISEKASRFIAYAGAFIAILVVTTSIPIITQLIDAWMSLMIEDLPLKLF